MKEIEIRICKPIDSKRLGVQNYEEQLAAAREHLASLGIHRIKPIINIRRKRRNARSKRRMGET